jgi:hypothetical protein
MKMLETHLTHSKTYLPDLQYQHLLNVNCGGNPRAQHLWQTVRPDLAAQAVLDVDNLTKAAI